MTEVSTPGRLLGVDYGERRIGVAASEGRVAVPVAIVMHTNRADDLDRVAAAAAEHGAEAIVVGLPLLMSGVEGEQVRRARRFGEALARRAEVPVIYHDERLSSFKAAEAGHGSKRARRHVDDVAASMILQSYIDALDAGGAAVPERTERGS